jgi:hypothetical protein
MTMSPATAKHQYWPCGGVLHGTVAISPCGAELGWVQGTELGSEKDRGNTLDVSDTKAMVVGPLSTV